MRLGQPIYHCKRTSDEEDDLITYSSPIKYTTRFGFINVQPASGYTDTVQYGESITKIWNGSANLDIFNGQITEGDVFYLDGDTPDQNLPNGENATALCTSVRPQNRIIRFTLERIKG